MYVIIYFLPRKYINIKCCENIFVAELVVRKNKKTLYTTHVSLLTREQFKYSDGRKMKKIINMYFLNIIIIVIYILFSTLARGRLLRYFIITYFFISVRRLRAVYLYREILVASD